MASLPDRRSIKSKVRGLVIAECANHQRESNGIANYCWAKEKTNKGVCVFFSDLESPRCQYFERSILALDQGLKTIFSSEVLHQEMQNGQKRMIRKKCDRCPEIFMAKSNAQRFCPKCQKAGYRDKARSWDRSNRKSAFSPLNPRNQAPLAL